MENKVYCHTECSSQLKNCHKIIFFTKGKYYEIDSEEEINHIITLPPYTTQGRKNGINYTYIKCNSGSYVGIRVENEFDKYFSTIKQLRKNKLEKLKLYEK